jgi:hypothetical protein
MKFTLADEILILLTTIINPRYWISNYPTNKEWDAAILRAIDMDCDAELSHTGCTVSIAGRSIWIANFPYAYGGGYGIGPDFLPSKRTRIKLRRFLSSKKIYVRE